MLKIPIAIYNREALSSVSPVDLFDPSFIEVSIIDKDNSVVTKPAVKRLSIGKYFGWVDESLLSDNQTYNVLWVYYLHPECPQVLRQSFIYNATPASIAGMCYIYGTEEIAGLPVQGLQVFIRQVKNGYSSAFSSGDTTSETDTFGKWGVFLPVNEIVVISVPGTNNRKTIHVPNATSADFSTITPYQTSVTTDSFGNPI